MSRHRKKQSALLPVLVCDNGVDKPAKQINTFSQFGSLMKHTGVVHYVGVVGQNYWELAALCSCFQQNIPNNWDDANWNETLVDITESSAHSIMQFSQAGQHVSS